jgi:hypothetical protein
MKSGLAQNVHDTSTFDISLIPTVLLMVMSAWSTVQQKICWQIFYQTIARQCFSHVCNAVLNVQSLAAAPCTGQTIHGSQECVGECGDGLCIVWKR